MWHLQKICDFERTKMNSELVDVQRGSSTAIEGIKVYFCLQHSSPAPLQYDVSCRFAMNSDDNDAQKSK